MKTNYKQSQAAPHAKPIFTVSRNDSTLYVLPAYLAGAVMIRLQHIADGDKVKKLCCKVKNDRLMAMEQDVPQGNVTLTAVDKLTERNGLPHVTVHSLRHPYVKPTTKKFASFLKFFRAAAIAARSCSIRYSWLMLPFQISPFLKSPA